MYAPPLILTKEHGVYLLQPMHSTCNDSTRNSATRIALIWCGFSHTPTINSNRQVTLALQANESHSTSVPWECLLTSVVDTTLHSFPFCAEISDRHTRFIITGFILEWVNCLTLSKFVFCVHHMGTVDKHITKVSQLPEDESQLLREANA